MSTDKGVKMQNTNKREAEPVTSQASQNSETSSSLSIQPLLNEKQLGAYLGIAARTLAWQRVAGNGPPYKKLGAGKKASVRYDLGEVSAWLESKSQSNTSQRRV